MKLAPEKPGWLARLIHSIFGGASERDPMPNWPTLIDMVQFAPDGTEVEFTVERGDAEPRNVKLTPAPIGRRVRRGPRIRVRADRANPHSRQRFGEQVRSAGTKRPMR